MASIDYQGAREELKRIFLKDKELGRKIVFWYDPPANFKEDLMNDNLDFCRLLVCNHNEFEIKKIVEHDDVTSDILIYSPSEKPKDIDNWLLDILMYSDEYYADTVALTMRRLNLTNTDLRKVIERHIKFFDSEARNKKLATYISIDDSVHADDMKLGMMAVLVKAAAPTIEAVLTELVFDDTQNSKYNELVKFGFEQFLWDTICIAYNYDGSLKIETLIKKFLFTAFLDQRTEFEKIPSFYSQFMIEGAGKMDAKFFIEKIKLDKRYEALQLSKALDMNIEGLIVNKDLASMQYADVFECIDINIIKNIASSLVKGSLDFETFEKIIASRINSMWYEKYKFDYEFLSASLAFSRALEQPILVGQSASDYIKDYTEKYYKIDTYYRRIFAAYKKIDNPIPEFEDYCSTIESRYEDSYLNKIGKEFSDALEKEPEWDFAGIQKTKDFYRLIQKHPFKKMFVIISDALRYEIGQEIVDNIKTDSVLKGGTTINYAISPLPSETRFGMANLLPHKTIEYADKAVFVDGKPTNSISARNAILQDKCESYAAISYSDINGFSRNELRAYMQDKTLVYIYHDVIDNAGEHNEDKVFDVAETAVNEIVALVRKLYNNLQISNFYITADHGFLYRKNVIGVAQKYNDIVQLGALEASKRYLLTDDENLTVPYTTEFKLRNVSEGQYKIIMPYAYDLFKTQGGGIQYVHGGASLQEIVVPIIHISELRATKNVETVAPVGIRLKSITRKITNRSFTLDFEQTEKVEDKKQPITCETFFIDEKENVVSGVYKFVANSSSDDPESRINRVRFTLKNIDFDRNKKYFLVLRNAAKQDEFIEREQFIIDILGFKIF